MKKPQYKIGDYVEFECPFIKSGDECVSHRINRGFIRYEFTKGDYEIRTRSGMFYDICEYSIIRKLPINRDKNGRFTSNKKDCSCFNCDKCAEQMRAYYEKTGELKPSNVTKGPVNNSTGGGKTTETVTEDYMYTLEFGQMPYDEFGSRVKTEEKKPSDRIDEIYRRIETMFSDNRIAMIAAIGDYLDEQWEKEKAK